MKKLIILFIFSLLFIKSALAEGNILKGYKIGSWNLDFGVNERLRNEYRGNFDFNDNRKDDGNLIYQRIKLDAKATLADKYEIFVQAMDIRVGNWHLKKTAQEDNFDLHQAYFRMNDIDGLHLDLKIGRQEMNYGKGRLVHSSTWANRNNHFDAVVMHYHYAGIYADLISGLKVGYDTNHFNRANTHEMLTGAYAGYQKDKHWPLVEMYFLSNIDTKSTNNLQRNTVGARLLMTIWQDIVFDFEMPYQFGTSSGQDVSAYAVHLDGSKDFDIVWKPKLTLTYNMATGDKKPGDNKTQTFVPLYQSTHDPYGIMDFFRWQNMQEAAIEISLLPCKKLKITPATNFFWLQSNLDSWYDASGNKLRTNTTGNANPFVGQEVSVVAKYDLSDAIKLEGGYAHFFSGPYVKDTGPNDDADWIYLQCIVKI